MGFARSIGCYDGMLVTSVGQQGSSLEAVYTVPENVCMTGGTSGGGGDSDGGAVLSCGVTTALFDEVWHGARRMRLEQLYPKYVYRGLWYNHRVMFGVDTCKRSVRSTCVSVWLYMPYGFLCLRVVCIDNTTTVVFVLYYSSIRKHDLPSRARAIFLESCSW